MVSNGDQVLEVGCGDVWLRLFLARADTMATGIVSDTAVAMVKAQKNLE